MTKQLLIAAASGASLLLTYLFFRKRFYNLNNNLQNKLGSPIGKHHLTPAFAIAKKHSLDERVNNM
jgi:hypothetical protein